MSKAPGKKDGENFRARRLSVSDIDTSEFDKAKGGSSSTPPARQRRLSLSPEIGTKAIDAPWSTEIIGSHSCHGIEPGARADRPKAKINQDRGAVGHPVCGDYNQALFMVFDGHGAIGDKVSEFVVHKVQELLEKSPELVKAEPERALSEAFLETDRLLKEDRTIDAELSGTTAIVVLYRRDPTTGTTTAYTACAGDSRAVIGLCEGGKWSAKDLSKDQKADDPVELARIKRAGGTVSPPEAWGGPARVWLDKEMTLPGLAMSRSIGDHLVGSVGVIAEPVVTKEVLDFAASAKPALMILASDGVWEFIDSQEAVALVASKLAGGAEKAAQALIECAANKWKVEEGDYRDDITAICIQLDDLFQKAIIQGPR